MSTRNDLLKNTFSNVINDYEYARPKYPQELYEQLLTFSRIDDKADILEVLINTYSSTQLLEEAVRTAYLDEIHKYIDDNGGIVEMPQLVMLYLVKK